MSLDAVQDTNVPEYYGFSFPFWRTTKRAKKRRSNTKNLKNIAGGKKRRNVSPAAESVPGWEGESWQ